MKSRYNKNKTGLYDNLIVGSCDGLLVRQFAIGLSFNCKNFKKK